MRFESVIVGQAHNEVRVVNLRYCEPVENRVHTVLADRLEAIRGLSGQIPDTLKDVWVQIALTEEAQASRLIDRAAAPRNPVHRRKVGDPAPRRDAAPRAAHGIAVSSLTLR